VKIIQPIDDPYLSIRVIDIHGRPHNANIENIGYAWRVEMEDSPSGIYYLGIQRNKAERVLRKIVKI
jgi:hypothetical protein